jgi:DNA-directed RNA polymerase subunit RPC12/RpoP
MPLDAGKVLKRAVWCSHCNEDFLFTLRAIAEKSELQCPGCGSTTYIRARRYAPLVSDVRQTLQAIDCIQLEPPFISQRSDLFFNTPRR